MSYTVTWPYLKGLLDDTIDLSPGRTCIIGGSIHSYKSGLLCDLFYQITTSNRPSDVSKMGGAYFFTMEERAGTVLERLYNRLADQVGLRYYAALSPQERANEVPRRLTEPMLSKGWLTKLVSLQMFDTERAVDEILKIVDNDQNSGVPVRLVCVDGLWGTDNPETENQLPTLLHRLSKSLTKKNVLFITTHQFNYGAIKEQNTGKHDRQLLNYYHEHKPWSGGGREISRAFDMELFVDRTRVDGAPMDRLDLMVDSDTHVLPADLEKVTITLEFDPSVGLARNPKT